MCIFSSLSYVGHIDHIFGVLENYITFCLECGLKHFIINRALYPPICYTYPTHMYFVATL